MDKQTMEVGLKVDTWPSYLLSRLHTLYLEQRQCDLKLKFKDKQVLKVHRLVVNLCTNYFKMLEKVQATKNEITLPPNFPRNIVNSIIDYMYTGTIKVDAKLFDKLLELVKVMNVPVLLDILEVKKSIMQNQNDFKKSNEINKTVLIVKNNQTPITRKESCKVTYNNIHKRIPATITSKALKTAKEKINYNVTPKMIVLTPNAMSGGNEQKGNVKVAIQKFITFSDNTEHKGNGRSEIVSSSQSSQLNIADIVTNNFNTVQNTKQGSKIHARTVVSNANDNSVHNLSPEIEIAKNIFVHTNHRFDIPNKENIQHKPTEGNVQTQFLNNPFISPIPFCCARKPDEHIHVPAPSTMCTSTPQKTIDMEKKCQYDTSSVLLNSDYLNTDKSTNTLIEAALERLFSDDEEMQVDPIDLSNRNENNNVTDNPTYLPPGP